MKKTLSAVSALALALSNLAAPAFAQDMDMMSMSMGMGMGKPDDTPPPVIDEFPELSEKCELNPNLNSGFTTLAINVDVDETTTMVDTGPTTRTYNDAGTPSTTITGPAHKHGQSVNIFGFITQKVTYSGATDTTPTLKTVTTTTTFDCHVHKPTNGNDKDDLHPGYNIAPFGLESASVMLVDKQETAGVRTQIIPGPIDVFSMNNEDGVICISPGKNPGAWRPANGYNNVSLGTCSTALYKAVGGETPSVSVPAT